MNCHFGPRSVRSLLCRTEMTEVTEDGSGCRIFVLRTEVDVYFISQDCSGCDVNSLKILLTTDVLMLPVT